MEKTVREVKRKLVAILAVGVFSLLGSNFVAAAEDTAGVIEHTAKAIERAQEALKYAHEGNTDQVLVQIKAARQHSKEITGDTWSPQRQVAGENLRKARSLAKKGDAAGAVAPLEEAIAALKEIHF